MTAPSSPPIAAPSGEGAPPAPRERTSRRPMRALVAVAYFAVIFQRSGLPYNTAPADFVIAVVLFIGLVWMCRQGSIATALLRRCAPWVWLIVIGSLLGLIGVGLPFWAFSSLARLIAALAAFFAFLHLFVTRAPRLLGAAVFGTWVGWGVTIFWLIVVQGYGSSRPNAFFSHPNYPGHYLVAAGLVLFAYHRTVRMRILIVAVTALGVFATASFGAMAMGGALLAVGLYRVVGRQVVALLVVVVSAIMLLILLFGFEVQIEADESTLEVNETVNQQRFERSREGRLELWRNGFESWTESPMGVGPDGVKQRAIGLRTGKGDKAFEIHADALGYLVERGLIGIAGYIGLWAVLWRSAEKRGYARALIVALLVAGLFRETMHYRHGWLSLAALFAIDFYDRRARDAKAEAEAEAVAAAEVEGRPAALPA